MTYNGWKNRATWNVSLWIQNDESLYMQAVSYVDRAEVTGKRVTWGGFCEYAQLKDARTPDGYKFDGKGLDVVALAQMLKELAS